MLRRCLTVIAFAMVPHSAAYQARPDTTQRRDTLPAYDTTTARDRIGDLNAAPVEDGAFPGALTIPGTRVSLAIGGFVKVLAFHDSNADERAADFSPADLVPDAPGGPTYGMTAGLSRLFVDGRASMKRGDVRGYIEVDFNGVSPEAATRVSAPPHGAYGSARGPDMVDVHERERTAQSSR